ncbi:MAG: DnaJ domain-containing protein [Sandaracinaceae bacterium]
MSDRLDALDYYTLFEVADDASADEIREAYHRFALRYHPDRHVGAVEGTRARAAEIFRRGAEGYRVLMDPESRRRYDRALEEGTLRLATEAPRDSRAPTPAHGVRSAKARPLAKKAMKDLARGDYRSAMLSLKMALAYEPDNAELKAHLETCELKLKVTR